MIARSDRKIVQMTSWTTVPFLASFSAPTSHGEASKPLDFEENRLDRSKIGSIPISSRTNGFIKLYYIYQAIGRMH